jgi:hypothetical protein
MTAAWLAQRSRGPSTPLSDEVGLAVVVLAGAARHASLLSLLNGGMQSLCTTWHAGAGRLEEALTSLRLVVAPPAVFGRASLPVRPDPAQLGCSFDCPLSGLLFGAALTAGWPWVLALHLFAGLRQGFACGGGTGFIPERGRSAPPGSSWLAGVLTSEIDASVSATVFFDADGIVFVDCTRQVFGSANQVRGPVPAWLAQKRTRWLPDYIKLATDDHGVPIYPKLRVTALVERRHVWERLVNMDGVTRATIMGKLCYPRIGWHILPSFLPNHKSWEVDEVKQKLGQKMAAYFTQGALEFVFPGHRLPTMVEPLGAVFKKGKDKYRAIADARAGNKSLADWGVRYYTASDLAAALTWRAIVFGADVNDGYHIAPLPGCTGDLVWGWGIIRVERVYSSDPDFEPPVVVAQDGSFQPAPGPPGAQIRFVFGWCLHLGCWSGSCTGVCDKSCNGMFFDGCVARWAAAHFGQKTAGCPLNCIALCLLRHAALRRPAPGELRGASSTSLLGVVWVDDFTFWHPVP